MSFTDLPENFRSNIVRDSHLSQASLKVDFQKICHRFVQCNNVRYQCFAEIWCDMKMPHIFRGRRQKRYLVDFINEAFIIAKDFLIKSKRSFQEQVCGLYLLYGLYNTQPHHPKIKIRMTLEQWETFLTFHKEIQDKAHLDMDFIIHRMILRKCFYFVASENPIIEFWTEASSTDPCESIQSKRLVRTNIAELMSTDLLPKLQAVHEQYFKMKCELNGPDATQPSRVLNVLQSGVVEFMKEKIESFEVKITKKCQGPLPPTPAIKGRNADEPSTSSNTDNASTEEEVSEQVGTKRASIKERAFQNKGKVRRDRRHRLGSPPGKSQSENEDMFSKQEVISSPPRRKKSADQEISSPDRKKLIISMPILISETSPKTKGKCTVRSHQKRPGKSSSTNLKGKGRGKKTMK